jgi:hypothetical protein
MKTLTTYICVGCFAVAAYADDEYPPPIPSLASATVTALPPVTDCRCEICKDAIRELKERVETLQAWVDYLRYFNKDARPPNLDRKEVPNEPPQLPIDETPGVGSGHTMSPAKDAPTSVFVPWLGPFAQIDKTIANVEWRKECSGGVCKFYCREKR